MRATPSSESRPFDGTPSMTMTLTGSETPSQIRPISASSTRPGMKKPDAPTAAYALALSRASPDGVGCVLAVFENHIRSSVVEEIDALLLRRLANGRNAARLPVDAVKPRAFDDPIFEIDANHAQIQKARNVSG